MKNAVRVALASATLALVPQLAFAQSARLATAKELKWSELDSPKGARQAVLWGDEKTSESGVLVRWPFNSKVADVVRTQDVHIVVLAGTFTVEVEGVYKEFGPSGLLVIPKGVKHTLGCEAAGECRFLVHHPGAVEVSKGK